jgi:hypothetical protein
MKVPEEKSQNFVVAIVVCAFIFIYFAVTVQRVVFGTPGL